MVEVLITALSLESFTLLAPSGYRVLQKSEAWPWTSVDIIYST